MEKATEEYGKDLSSSTKKDLERKLHTETQVVVGKAVGDFNIQQKILEKEREAKLAEAKTREERNIVNTEFNQVMGTEVKGSLISAGGPRIYIMCSVIY